MSSIPGWGAWAIPVALVILIVLVAVVRSRRRPGPTPTSLYIGALDALLSGDRDRGLELLRETVRADSGNVAAYIRLGTLFRERGEPGRAARIHREISVRPRIETSLREQALKELALDYVAQGNDGKTLVTLEELLKVNRHNVFAYEASAQLMEEQGRWDEAYDLRKELDRIVGNGGASLAAFQAHVGKELAAKGDTRGARDHFKRALKREKTSLPALLYLGDLEYQQGNLKEAIDRWRRAIQLHPNRAPWLYRRLEKAYFDLGQFETMLDVYEEVLKVRPEDERTLLSSAELHRKKGDLDEAQQIISRILEKDREHELARLYLGLIEAERGNAGEAARVLSGLVETAMDMGEGFTCRRCGYEVDEVLWRCPQCGRWETLEAEQ